MNATNYYVSTTRLVLQGDPDTPSTWQDLNRMLPTLRNSLSCTVCNLLLVEPYTPDETSCEHHVCKSCKGGVKTLRPTCSWCKDYTKYNENVQLRILIQNYKKLCGLIKITRMWGLIMRQGDQGQQIRDIISESEGERKGVRKQQGFEQNIKVDEEEDMKNHEELVEEEIVGKCDLVDGYCSDEPPDKIISSPISKLFQMTSLTRVYSEEVEAAKAFDFVPFEKEFQIKLLDEDGIELDRFAYKLRQGKKLPHTTKIQGIRFVFSKMLEPDSKGFLADTDGEWWTLQKLAPDSSPARSFDSSLASTLPEAFLPAATSSQLFSPEINLTKSPPGARRLLNLSSSSRSIFNTDVNRIVKIAQSPKELQICDSVFNIFWQYGEVQKITVSENGTVYVEMKSSTTAEAAYNSVQGLTIYKTTLRVELCSPRDVEDDPDIVVFSQDFSELEEGSKSSQPSVIPTKFLQLSISSPISDQEVMDLFLDAPVPPFSISWLKTSSEQISKSCVAYFSSVEDCAEALAASNFKEHEEDKVEMRFAVQPEPSALKVFEMDVTEEEMTQHTHPDWLNVVKKAITDDMALCSARTQQAVQNNEKIKIPRDHKFVQDEILNSIMKRIKKYFTWKRLPGIEQILDLALELTHLYPAMFFHTPEQSGKLAPVPLKHLAQKMRDRLRSQLRSEQAKDATGGADEVDEPAGKKGKTKNIYGLDCNKWHTAKRAKPDAVAAISAVNTEPDFNKREAVYDKYRMEIIAEFKASKKSIPQICKGFNISFQHLANQFQFMSGSPSLVGKVEENLKQQFDHLQKFLVDQCRTLEFQEEYNAVLDRSQTEFKGSSTPKAIFLLRAACKKFDDGTGAELVRLEEDGPPISASPHMFAVELDNGHMDRSYIFEIWVDEAKYLGNLNIATAIASYLHVAFCFDLKYPKGAETMSDLLQHNWAKYGDLTGTRTLKSKGSAEKKRDFYYSTIGRITTT